MQRKARRLSSWPGDWYLKRANKYHLLKNVAVFNLVNRILGLKYNGKVDGEDRLANDIFTKK